MAQIDDPQVWAHASVNSMVVVSKDEDFLHLCRRGKPAGRLLWVRLKNCRNAALISAFDKSLDRIVAAFDAGQTIVELR
jgi:predicted nuclease of predicted toxin-antitoxin system